MTTVTTTMVLLLLLLFRRQRRRRSPKNRVDFHVVLAFGHHFATVQVLQYGRYLVPQRPVARSVLDDRRR